jgi:hypothetical protein
MFPGWLCAFKRSGCILGHPIQKLSRPELLGQAGTRSDRRMEPPWGVSRNGYCWRIRIGGRSAGVWASRGYWRTGIPLPRRPGRIRQQFPFLLTGQVPSGKRAGRQSRPPGHAPTGRSQPLSSVRRSSIRPYGASQGLRNLGQFTQPRLCGPDRSSPELEEPAEVAASQSWDKPSRI